MGLVCSAPGGTCAIGGRGGPKPFWAGALWHGVPSHEFSTPLSRSLIRRLFVTCYFFVAFPWLFRGPLPSRKTVFGPFSWFFRGFFVVFSSLFRGPRFGQNLRVLALEQSSDLRYGKETHQELFEPARSQDNPTQMLCFGGYTLSLSPQNEWRFLPPRRTWSDKKLFPLQCPPGLFTKYSRLSPQFARRINIPLGAPRLHL